MFNASFSTRHCAYIVLYEHIMAIRFTLFICQLVLVSEIISAKRFTIDNIIICKLYILQKWTENIGI